MIRRGIQLVLTIKTGTPSHIYLAAYNRLYSQFFSCFKEIHRPVHYAMIGNGLPPSAPWPLPFPAIGKYGRPRPTGYTPYEHEDEQRIGHGLSFLSLETRSCNAGLLFLRHPRFYSQLRQSFESMINPRAGQWFGESFSQLS